MTPHPGRFGPALAALLLAATVASGEPADEHAGHAAERAREAPSEHQHEPGGVGSRPHPPAITDEERAAAFPDLGGATHEMLENPFIAFVLLDHLEWHDADDAARAELDAWLGRDLTRLWIRADAERVAGSTERAELTLLYGQRFAPWWDWVAGARQDFAPGASRTWAAFGVQGLAPYRFEVEATLFVGDGGRTAARLEAEHELLITNRLILEPRIELDWHGRADPTRGLGSGLASVEAGLRLRYEIRRELAPYIGLARRDKRGDTAALARASGADPDDTELVLGVRAWF